MLVSITFFRNRSLWLHLTREIRLEKAFYYSRRIQLRRFSAAPATYQVVLSRNPVSFVYNSNKLDELNLAGQTELLFWEPLSRTTFYFLAQHSNLTVDVGAYTGIYSITAALANVSGEVHAIEPNGQISTLLEKNIFSNGLQNRIQTHNFAAWSDFTLLSLYAEARMKVSSNLSVFPDSGRVKLEEVKGLPIDSLFEQPGKIPDLLKIDIEGAELPALLGMKRILTTGHPIILMEALTNEDIESQMNILSTFGYLDPIKIGSHLGDERNFLWIKEQDNTLASMATREAHALVKKWSSQKYEKT